MTASQSNSPRPGQGRSRGRDDRPPHTEIALAGIDVHASKFVAIVLKPGHELVELTCHSARRHNLVAFIAQLLEHDVQAVAIEATGVYWIRLAALLTEQGIEVTLANPQSVRAVAGRKTDSRDARRLAYALANNSLEPSFIAGPEQRELRALTRGRVGMVRSNVAHKNRSHKVLRSAGIPLKDVVSDLFSQTMLPILDALAAGHEPNVTNEALKFIGIAKRDKVREVLDGGFCLNAGERIALTREMKAYRLCAEAISEYDAEIEAWLEAHPEWKRAVDIVDSIPHIGRIAAAAIVAECGIEMTRFASERHFASWTGLCPGQRESAGKKGSSKSPKGNPYVKRVLTECSQSLARPKKPGSDGYSLQQWMLRLNGRMPWNKAVTAVAHRMSRLVWTLLTRNESYSEAIHGQMLERDQLRRMRKARRYLESLGMLVIPQPN